MLSQIHISKTTRNDPYFCQAISTLADCLNKKQVTLFTGAGVSRASGLPLSKTIINIIVEAMLTASHKIGLGAISDREMLKNAVLLYPLERHLDALIATHGGSALRVLSVLESSTYNYTHKAVAALAKHGYLDTIVTLNFDVLFETALLDARIPFMWNLPLALVRQPFINPIDQVSIIKPHGTLPIREYPYEEHYLAATLRFAGNRPQKENLDEFKSIAHTRPVLVVAGYSDDDWDITPILMNTAWSTVFWIEHVAREQNVRERPAKGKPSEKVLEWLHRHHSTYLIYGDIQILLNMLLANLKLELDTSSDPIQQFTRYLPPEQKPNVEFLLARSEATALSAVTLLDGTQNDLYERLLYQLGKTPGIISDNHLYDLWIKAVAWHHHIYRRDIRKAINLRSKFVVNHNAHSENRDLLAQLGDDLSLYYEFLSAAKRPYFNLRWPFDLISACRLRRIIQKKVLIIKSRDCTPWENKEADRNIAFTHYYIVDLWHNWGYHLLPFSSKLIRYLTRFAFRKIEKRYRDLMEKYPVLNWEYHYIRSIEAALIANVVPSLRESKSKINRIIEFFHRTGQIGHEANTEAIFSILLGNREMFKQASERITNKYNTTPTGILRMILLNRYFWPNDISLFSAIKAIYRYSKAQQQKSKFEFDPQDDID